MKKLIFVAILVFGFSSAHAQDETQEMEMDPQLIEQLHQEALENSAAFYSEDDSMDIQANRAWTCGMEFRGVASGVRVIIGRYTFNGTGTLKCTGANGKKVSYPIRVTMRSGVVSPGVSIGHQELIGRAADISLLHSNPKALLGNYYIAHGQGSIVRGAGVITGVKAGSDPQITVKVSLQFTKGLGVNLGLDRMKISLR